MTVRYLVGDVFERMAELPDGSVDLVMTSPPFLALRNYLPEGHPDKVKEIGSEATPAAFIDTLLELTAEWRRVLAPHGSIAVELGDTYAGSGGAGGDYGEDGLRAGQAKFSGSAKARRSVHAAWPPEKSLCGIPGAYELSLAYGFNVLDRRGPDSPAGMWRVRNHVAWVRPNPPVGALGDKFRPGTSYVTIGALAHDRWFDLDAVRQPAVTGDRVMRQTTPTALPRPGEQMGGQQGDRLQANHPAGAPPLDWWEIPPGGYRGAHYAVFPPELPRRPIQAMCPRRVCRTCGTPSRRIVTTDRVGRWPSADALLADPDAARERAERYGYWASGKDGGRLNNPDFATTYTTTGWTTCGCPGAGGLRLDGYHRGDGWRPGVVLDPFGGSGTTGLVAVDLGRDAILIDIDERNAELAAQRLGFYLTEVSERPPERVA